MTPDTIKRLNQKSGVALSEIHNEYKTRLRWFAYQLVEDDFWAEVLYQKALIKLWHSQFNNEEEIKDFLYSQIRDLCLEYLCVHKPEMKFTDEEINQLFMTAEILNEINNQ